MQLIRTAHRRRLAHPIRCGAGLFLVTLLGYLPAMAQEEEPAFPVDGLMPKTETGALRFLEEHPTFDDRDVVVAVFDTGIDPGAAGLQTTSDGRPKIIDLVDATGSGDVDTSTVRQVHDGRIEGLSGRDLTVPSSWVNPSGQYHLGLKAGYELYPDGLTDRLREERRERWEEQQRTLETRLRRELAAWNQAHPQPSAEEIKEREDLETRLDQLRLLQKDWEDPGPIHDCVVFHDGELWRAMVDTDEDGDLTDERLLTDYRRALEYGTFEGAALLNFAVNIYEEGRVLSIVTDSGMHGTHVAGIVAAHFPGEPELNGMAPGAQLVSVKIGDTRLGGMETATGFTRGLRVVRDHRCDIINLSYGEPTTLPDRGRIPGLLADLVNEDGVIFVSSAGNAGPALTTVGAPGGTTSALIGVGAYVSPAMMEMGYSMRQSLPEMLYTWSSRGPTADGNLGVSVSAPGGAISPVPNWTLQRSQMANGTSMASPNAAGAVALIVSGLKAEQIPVRPHWVRQALENTARAVDGAEVFAQGHGLVQVDRAFEVCRLLGRERGNDPWLRITVAGRDGARGVYLREPEETRQPLDLSIRVAPVYRKEADNREKVAFERRYRIESTAPWVEAAGHLLLLHGGRSFDVRVDPTQLRPGVHTAEVLGWDTSLTEVGPTFRVPVTVVRPMEVEARQVPAWQEEWRLDPGQLNRRFFAVPAGATWAELKVRAGELAAPYRMVAHAMQVVPRRLQTATEMRRYLTLEAAQQELLRFPVVGGRMLELCLGPLWSTLDPATIEFSLSFHGILPADETVILEAAAGVTRVEATAALREVRLAPRGDLRIRRRTLAPSETEMRPLTDTRDLLPEGRQVHELILSYRFNLEADRAVTARFPGLNGRLYDGEFESQLMMIFDANRRLEAVDDGWDPGEVRLNKGEHVLRFHLRHDRVEWLEALKTLALLLDEDLASPMSVRAYADPDRALTQGSDLSGRDLAAGERTVFWLGAPEIDKLTQAGQPGDLLIGTVRYESGDGARSYPLICTVPPASKSASKKEAPATEERPTTDPEQRWEEELRDWKVAQLDRLAGSEADMFERVLAELKQAHPEHLPLYVKELHHVDNDNRARRLRSVVAAADEVIRRIDTAEVARGLGTRPQEDDAADGRSRRELETRKEMLIDALYRKGRALAWMELPDEEDAPAASDPEEPIEPPFDTETIEREFEATFADLHRWIEPTAERVALLNIRREWRHSRLGNALELLQQQIQRAPADKKLLQKRVTLLRDLGWTSWAEHEERTQLLRFPERYPRF